jgi:hypothetical protein
MEGSWIRRPQGEASAIFVHGILSSGETCWRNDNGSYWPELLKDETELRSLGIYVFTYETRIFSGSYKICSFSDYHYTPGVNKKGYSEKFEQHF